MNRIAMIAAAGRGSRMLNLTDNNPKAMLPFNGKPIIGHHLDFLIDQGFKEVVIVVGYKKEKLIHYVNTFYSKKIMIRFAEQKELNGLAGALDSGVQILTKYEKENKSLFILLGDIIIAEENLPYDINFVGYDTVPDWSRWCMVEVNKESNIVVDLIDKPDKKPKTNHNLMGVYNITNIKEFEFALNNVFLTGERIKNEFQLSSVLKYYIATEEIFGVEVKYYDLGELEALNKTRKNLTRHFNSIEVTDDNTIIKRSSNKTKIKQEIAWYLSIDNKLKLYTPHLIDWGEDADSCWYELEFIHSSPLQELYLFNLPERKEWEKIFKSIKKYVDKSATVRDRYDISNNNYEVIIEKTRDRVRTLVKECDFAKDDFVTINNIVYKNPASTAYLYKVLDKAYDIFVDGEQRFGALHGDLFFGNMLYDVNTGVLKVIDPRGKYGADTIRGDLRYDIAKLNHSIVGYYDFIINGLYFLEEVDGKFFYQFYESNQDEVKELFKEIILTDYDEKEIQLLTGILFLSMIPLHKENPTNQKMQFIRAVELLQDFI